MNISLSALFKKLIKKSGLSQAEILLALVVIFLIFVFVVMPMLKNFTHTKLKEQWINVFIKVKTASRMIQSGSRKTLKYKFNNEQDIINEFSTYLLPTKTCTDSRAQGCWSTNWLWGYDPKPGIVFEKGAFMVSEFGSSTCEDRTNSFKTCGALIIDTNGEDGPNKIGQDILKVYIMEDEIKPAGIEGDIINPSFNCSFGEKYDWGCSAKYLYKL